MRFVVLEDVDDDDDDDQHQDGDTDAGEDLPTGHGQCKDKPRDEEEYEHDVDRGEPPVIRRDVPQPLRTFDRKLSHEGHRIEDHDTRDVEKEMHEGYL